MPDVLCPSCKEQIEPGAARCAACDRALTGPGGQRAVATRRDIYGEMPEHEAPGVGPGRPCRGCDGSLIEIVDGQVVAHSLITCDTDFCYYEGTLGGVA